MDAGSYGPWEIEGLLGRGGMGSVYRARHTETGQSAALKTLRTAARPSEIASLRREIRALSHLHHPGVVPILDEGEDDGVPWYAMELVEGVSLQAAAAQTRATHSRPPIAGTTALDGSTWFTRGGTPLPPPRREATPMPTPGPVEPVVVAWALGVVRELCEALGFLHGEGVVHRDLKPANVLLRDSGSPVLVDFGLAVGLTDESGREAAVVSGSRAGTPWFMSPEQVRGDPVDPRSDLYSLGCMLFFLVAGQPPFPHSDALAAMTAHLTQPAPGLDSVVPGVPPALTELVAALLRKRPGERMGYASDVIAALDAAGVPEPRQSGPPARTYLYRPSLVGRDAELARIEGLLSVVAAHGAGGCLWVRGEGGVGKTRLMSEALSRGAERGVRVWVGACAPLGTRGLRGVARESPLGPLLQPLQGLVDEARADGPARVVEVFGTAAATLAPYVPALASLAGDVSPASTAEQERSQVYDALRDVLGRAARRRPLALLIDDLQWADPWTVGFLRSIVGRVPDGVLVAATWRAEESNARLDELWDRGSHTEALHRLSGTSVGAIATSMLAADVPAPFAEWLAERTEGNPFYVGQYLQSAVETGALTRARARWTLPQTRTAIEALPVPQALADLLHERLERLSALDLEVVHGMAVLGRTVALDDLQALMDRTELDLAEALGRAHRAHLVEPHGAGYRFVHDRVREVAYEDAGEARPALHRRAAEHVEATLDARSDRARWLSDLATHWARAGERARARPLFAAAAEGAARHGPLSEYLRLTRAYLAAGPLDLEGVLLFAAVAHTMIMQRPYDPEALALVDESAALAADEGSEVARQAYDVLRALKHSLHREPDATEALVRPIVLAPAHPTLERRAVELLAVCHQRRGEFDTAIHLRERAAEVAARMGDARAHLLQVQALLELEGRVGRFEAVRARIEEARPDETDPDETTRFLMMDGLSLESVGRYRDALDTALRGERISREHRLLRRQAVFGSNGGYWAIHLDDFDLAERLLDVADQAAREPYLRTNVQLNRELLGLYAGRSGAAARLASVMDEATVSPAYWHALGNYLLTWAALDREDLAGAERHFAAIDPLQFITAEKRARRHHLHTRLARLRGDLDQAEASVRIDMPHIALTAWGMACERAHLAAARGQDVAAPIAEALTRWSVIQLDQTSRFRRWLEPLA